MTELSLFLAVMVKVVLTAVPCGDALTPELARTSESAGKTSESANTEAAALLWAVPDATDTDEPKLKDEGDPVAATSLPIVGVELATAAQRGNKLVTNAGSGIEMGAVSRSGA